MKDWRIIDQEKYLKGKILNMEIPTILCKQSLLDKNGIYEILKKNIGQQTLCYEIDEKQLEQSWHEHCEFCSKKITSKTSTKCYCTEDYYYWICNKCFNDFKKEFEWTVKDNVEYPTGN